MNWISVNERLPEDPGTYLVTVENPTTKQMDVWIEYYDNRISPEANISDETVFDNGYAFGSPYADGLDDLANVFAWMPVPEPFNPDEGK